MMFNKRFYFLIIILIALASLLTLYTDTLAPKALSDKLNKTLVSYPIEVTINDGETLPQVAESLYSSNIIKSKALFRLWLGIINLATDIRPGVYIFNQPESLSKVVQRFADKKPDRPAISVTIPEGFTDIEIIDRVMYYLPHLSRDKFLALAKDKEGMLFPDTYYLQSTMREQDVIDLMFNNFKNKTNYIKLLNDGYDTKSFNDILVMASILEGEAKSSGQEMRTIAGILYNRMQNGMKLQVDVAPDTYKKLGLPAYPISNPGLESIQAAMHPLDNPYMYYLHDKLGLIKYAKTYIEHQKNISKYLK